MITNPFNPRESYSSRLWPDHCVQDTPGADLLPALATGQVDRVIRKGQRGDVEMYSAFYAPLREPRVGDSGLAAALREESVTDVYVVGLAADYCVRATAVDAAQEGFRAWIVEEATRPVDAERWEGEGKEEVRALGVGVVGMGSAEVKRVR